MDHENTVEQDADWPSAQDGASQETGRESLSVAYINPALEHLAVPCALITAPGDLLYMNPAFETVVGRPRAMAFGHRLGEFVHPDDQEKLRTILREISARPGEQMSAQLNFGQGKLDSWARWQVIMTNALADARTAGIVLSLSPLEGEASNLQPVNAVEETAAQIIPLGTHWLIRGNVRQGLRDLFVVDKTREKFQLSTNRVVDPVGFLKKIFFPEDLEKISQQIQRLTPQQQEFRTHIRLYKPDGTLGTFESRVFCQYDDAGEVVSACGTLRETTKEVRSAQEYHELKTFLEFLGRYGEDVVMRMSRDLKVTYVTQTVTKLLGYSPAQLLNRHVSEFDGVHNHETLEAVLKEVVETGENQRVQLLIDRADGEKVIVEVNYTPVSMDGSGEITEVLAVMRDISDRARATQALEDAAQIKSRFLSNVSHELKTPLSAIIGFSDMIVNQVNGPIGGQEYVEYGQMIRQSGHHLMEIVTDILDVSRLEAGRYLFRFEGFSPRSLVEKALANHEVDIEQRHLKIRKMIGEGLPSLDCDGDAVVRILNSIISNAVKFSPDGGEVTIGVRVKGDMIQFAINDQGCGIDEEALPQIMALFHQQDSRLARKYEGIGIGLTLANGLTVAHNGNIEVRSKMDEGTRVIVSLPIDRDE